MVTTEKPLVALQDVNHEFDEGRLRALRNVNLAITEGETVAIVGRSGSGKTTLVHLMSGLTSPTKGQVLWKRTAVRSREEWATLRRLSIGIIFQEFNLLPTLTASEGVEIAMFGTGVGREERIIRTQSALVAVGLSHRSRHHPYELSGGERQRVAIARSIVNRPALLLADEPTGNLDSANAAAIMDLLFELHDVHRTALVIVTHDPSFVKRCNRVIELKDGMI